MAKKSKTPFQRPLGELRYKKLFVIASEGSKTEPQYFGFFKTNNIHIKFIPPSTNNSPPQIRKGLEKDLKGIDRRKTDEVWIVLDKDAWTDDQLMQVFQWSQKSSQYGFALSNPNFEYWLLLHFEEGTNISSSQTCMDRLRKHLSDYKKAVAPQNFPRDRIDDAIKRAKERDNPPCEAWPQKMGSTTVYKLVEALLGEKKDVLYQK